MIAETEQLLAARKKLEEDDKEVAQDPLAGFTAYLETSEAGGSGHRSIAESCLANYRRKPVADKAANGAESADVVRVTEKAVQQAKRTFGEAKGGWRSCRAIEGAASAPSAGDKQFGRVRLHMCMASSPSWCREGLLLEDSERYNGNI